MSIKINYKHSVYQELQSSFIFNGGEVQVVLPEYLGYNIINIEAKLHNSDDVMRLLMVNDALRRYAPGATVNLRMPYVPYARQDRVCNEGEALSIKVFCDLINSMNFNKVTITDPHSDVTPALLNNCVIISQEDILDSFKGYKEDWDLYSKLMNNEITLVSPDAGAEKKILKVAQYFGGLDIIHASKVRDTRTGNITETKINDNPYPDGKDLLIVDDICDGGFTFIKLAEQLKRLNPRSINLYVTHGIFSKGYQVLFDAGIKRIYTTDSFPQKQRDGLIIASL